MEGGSSAQASALSLGASSSVSAVKTAQLQVLNKPTFIPL